MASESFIIVGKLGRPRGVHGEIFVTPATDFPERFVGLEEIFVRERDGWTRRKLTSARLVSGRPALQFENVDSPEEAARLTNRDLAVPRDQVVDLPEDTYYIFDLLECEVVEAETGRRLGHVADVEQYPANDVYVIEDAHGKRLRCPAVKQYVRKVDLAARRIEVTAAGLSNEDMT
ncbi:MAG: ribosome maturation factor RimM [Candidatus Zixiibacteriota bacterium]